MSIDAGGNGTLVSWQHPLREIRILMHSETLKTLSGEALRWLLSRPSAEIGGILWGTFSSEGGASVLIEDAEFVFSENSFFNETAADAGRLKEALSRQNKAGFRPVGYFRSHLRDGLSLAPQDQRLIESDLRDPRSVCLLIRPYQMGICMAAFFFWENGRLQADTSDLEVPFVALHDSKSKFSACATEISAEIPTEKSDESEPLMPAPLPALAASSQTVPEPAKSSAALSKRLLFQTVAAAALLGTAAGWLVYVAMNGWHLHRDWNPSLHLQVTRLKDGQLDLTWNGRVPARSHAGKGTITIQDGTKHREIVLNEAQLRSGKLPYFPISDDVQFRLDIPLDRKQSIVESLHVAPPVLAGNRTAERERPALFSPPRPLKQVMPDVGLIQPVALSQSSQVSVQVTVDVAGKVTDARVLRAGTRASDALIPSTLAAARNWTFEPATLAGKPVPATHTIRFEFDQTPR